MCGIAGIVDRALAPAEGAERVERMLACLLHRGPDSAGRLDRPEAGFYAGMRRLKIVDLAGGEQPIWNETGDVAVLFNGEIYNHRALRKELSAAHRFTTHSDTEVLVHLYEENGLGMLDALRGMYAFCLLDLRQGTLLLARDPFGQKPLYYAAAAGRFAFASELKALWVDPGLDATPDPARFLDYVSWLSLPPPLTHFRGVAKLAPGEYLRVDLDTGRAGEPVRAERPSLESVDRLATLGEAADRLDAALRESVRLHLEADVPVGILLSGGIDSLAVAAYAQREGAGSLQAFTAAFDDDGSEAPAAGAAAARFGFRHRSVPFAAADLLSEIDRVAWHLDEPVGDPAAFALGGLCTHARGEVKVLLSGEGADELFAGYGVRYAGMLSTLQRSDLVRRARQFLPSTAAPYPATAWGRLCKRVQLLPGEEIAALRVEGFPKDVLDPIGLNRAQQERLRLRQREIGMALSPPRRDRLNQIQEFDLAWQLPESLLQKADKMSMAASIELRCPFLDSGVAAIAAAIPSSLRLDRRNAVGKLVLRTCLDRLAPGAGHAPKKGFFLPLARWLRGDLRAVVADDLFQPESRVAQMLDRPLLQAAWDRFLRGEPLAEIFYALWLYERWTRVLAARRPRPATFHA
jgi:asparagine synthase (glutamine-hydrolysing)